MKWWFKQQLYTQIFFGIVLGIIAGIFLGSKVVYIKPIGDIFIRLLMMLIVPLTFFTLISGITKLENLRSFRTIGSLTIIYYLASSLFSAALGLVTGLIIKPGKNAVGILETGTKVAEADFNFIDNLVSWFPKNPIKAMTEGNMLQIIIFSIILGLSLLAMEQKGKNLTKIFHDGADLMITVTEFVMKTAPYGIMALVANMVASIGKDMLAEVGRFIMADFAAMGLLLVVFYPPLIKFISRLNPIRFYRNISPAMLVAGSTTSSGATLPVSMTAAEDNLGISEKVWGFTLPLGVTVNMNGMAASIGVISVFAANLYGVPITPALILQIVFLGLVLSVGTAGVKGGGIVMSGILLQTLNMPLTLIPILASIWPVIDIGHTTCNVTGDLVGTTIVSSRMKLINPEIFYRKNPESTKEKK